MSRGNLGPIIRSVDMTAPDVAVGNFHDHGFLLNRAEVAAIIAITGRRILRFVDGGLGLIGIGDDVALGTQLLMSRGLMQRSGASPSGIIAGEFLAAFFQVLDRRTSSIEIRMNSVDPGAQVSHWSIRCDGDLAIVRSEVDAGVSKYWFGLLSADWQGRFVDALVKPQVPLSEALENCVVGLDYRDFSRLFSAVRTRDSAVIEQRLSELSIDDVSRQEFSRLLVEDFRGVEITRQDQNQSWIEAEQLTWLESPRFGFWEMTKFPVESRVQFASSSRAEINKRYASVTGRTP